MIVIIPIETVWLHPPNMIQLYLCNDLMWKCATWLKYIQLIRYYFMRSELFVCGSVLDLTVQVFLSGGIGVVCVWLQYSVSFSLSNLYQSLSSMAILRGALCHIKSTSKIWQRRMASHTLSRLYNICCYFEMFSKPISFQTDPLRTDHVD